MEEHKWPVIACPLHLESNKMKTKSYKEVQQFIVFVAACPES